MWENPLSILNALNKNDDTPNDELEPGFLLTLNMLMFYGWNWIFILVNTAMFYKIRHIGDKFNAKLEIGLIIGIYTGFCYIQYSLYIMSLAGGCF